MPLYTYICPDDHEEDVVFSIHVDRPKVLPCRVCRKPSMRLFTPVQLNIMKPYVTQAGDGIPTEIRSAAEERAYEKKHGIAHLLDSDIKRMREGLGGQKDRIQKRERDKVEPFAESYERTKAKLDKMGSEFKREQAQKENHDMAKAIG